MSTVKWGENKRLRRTYYGMLQRCYNPKLKQYKDYGGRGIGVCNDWIENPQLFIEWALANGYDNSKNGKWNSIDRIDNNGNYSPKNCRWVDMATQGQNKRPAKLPHFYKFGNKNMSVNQFCAITNCSYTWIHQRIKHGVTLESAFDEYITNYPSQLYRTLTRLINFLGYEVTIQPKHEKGQGVDGQIVIMQDDEAKRERPKDKVSEGAVKDD